MRTRSSQSHSLADQLATDKATQSREVFSAWAIALALLLVFLLAPTFCAAPEQVSAGARFLAAGR